VEPSTAADTLELAGYMCRLMCHDQKVRCWRRAKLAAAARVGAGRGRATLQAQVLPRSCWLPSRPDLLSPFGHRRCADLLHRAPPAGRQHPARGAAAGHAAQGRAGGERGASGPGAWGPGGLLRVAWEAHCCACHPATATCGRRLPPGSSSFRTPAGMRWHGPPRTGCTHHATRVHGSSPVRPPPPCSSCSSSSPQLANKLVQNALMLATSKGTAIGLLQGLLDLKPPQPSDSVLRDLACAMASNLRGAGPGPPRAPRRRPTGAAPGAAADAAGTGWHTLSPGAQPGRPPQTRTCRPLC
jgi:hypothetical protein